MKKNKEMGITLKSKNIKLSDIIWCFDEYMPIDICDSLTHEVLASYDGRNPMDETYLYKTLSYLDVNREKVVFYV